MTTNDSERGAVISPCGRYRYHLWRRWGEGPAITFIMLNPSTADGLQDDPTIRKCMGFARRLGATSIRVGNLFAYRATDPAELRRAGFPQGIDNEPWLERLAACAHANNEPVICAWGAHARSLQAQRQVETVRRILTRVRGLVPLHVFALRKLADGTPAHPLMLPYSTELVRWS